MAPPSELTGTPRPTRLRDRRSSPSSERRRVTVWDPVLRDLCPRVGVTDSRQRSGNAGPDTARWIEDPRVSQKLPTVNAAAEEQDRAGRRVVGHRVPASRGRRPLGFASYPVASASTGGMPALGATPLPSLWIQGSGSAVPPSPGAAGS